MCQYLRIIRDSYPALWAWIRKFEDLSAVGMEEEVSYESGEVVTRLLEFAVQVYLPFLRANNLAIDNGEKTVSVSEEILHLTPMRSEISKACSEQHICFQLSLWADSEDAVSHSQPAFKYQHKCYQRLKHCYEELGSSDKERIDRRVSSFF